MLVAVATGMLVLTGLALAVVLVIASERLWVESDPRADRVQDLLPGANCGSCGFAGCAAFAEAMVEGGTLGGTCPVADETARRAIADVLGTEVEETAPQVAFVHCGGGHRVVARYDYDGIVDCRSIAALQGGAGACPAGCLGGGTCVAACTFGAIVMGQDGLPEVRPEACVACGACVKACPRDLISLVPKGSVVHVNCSSHEKGGAVKKVCEVGCIGCKKCEKACPSDAIHVVDFLAEMDYDACVSCMACVSACPTGAIVTTRAAKVGEEEAA